MKLKYFAYALLGVTGLFALMWGLAYHNIAFQGFFRPKMEAVRYKVHKESQAFRDGQIREIRSFLIQHAGATSEAQKRLLCRNIRDLADQIEPGYLPAELQNQVASLGAC